MKKHLHIYLLSAAGMLTFSNCGPGFNIDAASTARTQVLSAGVFKEKSFTATNYSEDVVYDSNGNIVTTGTADTTVIPTSGSTGVIVPSGTIATGTDGTVTTPTGTGGVNVPYNIVPISAFCPSSNDDVNAKGMSMRSVSSTSAIELLLLDPTRNFQVVCQTTNGVRDGLLNKKLDLSGCSGLTLNTYAIVLRDPVKMQPISLYKVYTENGGLDNNAHINYITRTSANAAWDYAFAAKSASMSFVQSVEALKTFQPNAGLWQNSGNGTSFWADRSANVGARLAVETTTQMDTTTGLTTLSGPGIPYVVYANPSNPNCDLSFQVDPLVIDMSSNSGVPQLTMTAPEFGVMIDILGGKSIPAHAPVQVSWIKNPNFMFLALPKSDGSVTGIDQLFGNDTFGPDGKYASDGFAALAKYDQNHDGVIDARDPIFSQLRLWSDRNLNGVAESNELFRLSDMGIVSIDLRYDKSFLEQDVNGNVAKYKSVVRTSKGQLKTIFDLWMKRKL